MLCLNGCRIENVKYNDSYVNLVLKDGFLKRVDDRTDDAMLSIEGDEEVMNIFLTEVIPKENEQTYYRTKKLNIEDFIKKLQTSEAVITEEYHSANRIILRGEIYRPAKLLELNHHLHMFELQLRTKNDLRMFYYFND
ncbi:MAG: hypothetical protein K2L02_02365 [Clostridia bacterium]|nr:hypothetical protein [Clostridia bacterium]